jgi:hypothetical protein
MTTKQKGFPRGHDGFHVSMKDPAKLLIRKLKQGKLTDVAFVDAVNNLAKLLYDSQFEKPETREILRPILDTALKNDWVSGPSFTWAFNLSRRWQLTPNYTGPYVPPSPKEPSPEELAAAQEAKKEADLAARKREEEKREADARKETSAKLERSAFLDATAQTLYQDARKAGKTILYQLPDGRFVDGTGFEFSEFWRDILITTGAVIVWLKSSPGADYIIEESDDSVRWVVSQKLLEKRDQEKWSRIRDSNPRVIEHLWAIHHGRR